MAFVGGHGEVCGAGGRLWRNFKTCGGTFGVPFTWTCCAKFCKTALLDIVGGGAKGLVDAFIGGVIERKER